jgi:peptide/nickel transport system substrate-binding protein
LFDWAKHNANYTQWTLNIKPGLKWSDGTPVNSTDVLTSEGPKYAFNQTYNFEGLLQRVTKEYALNSSAVVFVENKSDAYLLNEFALDGAGGTPVLPARIINKYGAAYPNLGTDLSMGPYYVSDYVAGSTQMVMYRNAYFTPAPKICEIQVSFVGTLSLTAARLQAGVADLAPLDPSTAASVLKTPNLHVLDEKAVGAASFEYNDSVFPYNMLPFRQALVYGINQSEFIQKAYSGYATPAYSAETATPTSAGMFYNPNTFKYSFDPAKAQSLLQSVNITKGSDGFLHYSNGSTVSLTLWTDTDNTEDLAGAGVVQADLQKLGFKVNLITTSQTNIAGDYGANTNNIRKDIILFSGYVLNPPNALVDGLPACSVEWLPPNCSHHFFYPPSLDAQYQANLTGVLGTADPAQEQKYLFNIQAMEAKYLPAIILAYPDFLWGYSTAAWTNWPNPVTGHMDEGLAEVPNMTAWESLTPVGAPPVTSINSTTTTSVVQTSSSTTGGGGGINSSLLLALGAVVVVILAAVVITAARRRPKKT